VGEIGGGGRAGGAGGNKKHEVAVGARVKHSSGPNGNGISASKNAAHVKGKKQVKASREDRAAGGRVYGGLR